MVTVLLLPFIVGGWRIGKTVAIILMVLYVAYVIAQAYGVALLMMAFG